MKLCEIVRRLFAPKPEQDQENQPAAPLNSPANDTAPKDLNNAHYTIKRALQENTDGFDVALDTQNGETKLTLIVPDGRNVFHIWHAEGVFSKAYEEAMGKPLPKENIKHISIDGTPRPRPGETLPSPDL